MRCKNCGWENPENIEKCEKCHAELGASPNGNPTNPTENESNRMRNTISEKVAFESSRTGNVPKTCPQCGYPLGEGTTSCPNCNHIVTPFPQQEKEKRCTNCGELLINESRFCHSCGKSVDEGGASPNRPQIRRATLGTVWGGPISNSGSQTTFCTLRPIAWNGEEVTYSPITYSGEYIILNRSNTDPNNNTITSREQAALTFQDGEWYLENLSEMKTTFIRVGKKVKLASGDIIVMGNREFEFKG